MEKRRPKFNCNDRISVSPKALQSPDLSQAVTAPSSFQSRWDKEQYLYDSPLEGADRSLPLRTAGALSLAWLL